MGLALCLKLISLSFQVSFMLQNFIWVYSILILPLSLYPSHLLPLSSFMFY